MTSTRDSIFYFHPQVGINKDGSVNRDDSKAVAAKYLLISGQKVPDPAGVGSNLPPFYSRLNKDGTIDGQSTLPDVGNYLIVPANYDPSEAEALAKKLKQEDQTSWRGWYKALMEMRADFSRGGQEDLQRGARWGVLSGEVGAAFKDSTSWHLGYVTRLANIPPVLAKIGGGLINDKGFAGAVWRRMWYGETLRYKLPSFPYGLDRADQLNIELGVKYAQSKLLGKSFPNDASPTTYKNRTLTLHRAALAIGRNKLGGFAPLPGRPSLKERGPSRPGAAGAVAGILPAAARTLFAAQLNYARGPGTAAASLHRGISASAIHGIARRAVSSGPARLYRAGSGSSAAGSPLASVRAAGGLAPIRHAGAGTDLGTVMWHGHRPALPSIAPIGHGNRPASEPLAPPVAAPSGVFAPAPPGGLRLRSSSPAADGGTDLTHPNFLNSPAGRAQLSQAVSDLLDRQARMPPSGATGFDPRLSPAWSGLKLPN